MKMKRKELLTVRRLLSCNFHCSQVPTYSFADIILNDCSVNYTAGAFPCLEVRFLVQRKRGYYYTNASSPHLLS